MIFLKILAVIQTWRISIFSKVVASTQVKEFEEDARLDLV